MSYDAKTRQTIAHDPRAAELVAADYGLTERYVRAIRRSMGATPVIRRRAKQPKALSAEKKWRQPVPNGGRVLTKLEWIQELREAARLLDGSKTTQAEQADEDGQHR